MSTRVLQLLQKLPTVGHVVILLPQLLQYLRQFQFVLPLECHLHRVLHLALHLQDLVQLARSHSLEYSHRQGQVFVFNSYQFPQTLEFTVLGELVRIRLRNRRFFVPESS